MSEIQKKEGVASAAIKIQRVVPLKNMKPIRGVNLIGKGAAAKSVVESVAAVEQEITTAEKINSSSCCSGCCGGDTTIPMTETNKATAQQVSTSRLAILKAYRFFVIAIMLALMAELADWLNWPVIIEMAFSVIAIGCVGIDTYRKGLSAIVRFNLNMNALMTIAVTGALCIGQWPEAAMVMVLFSLSEKIEAYSVKRARGAIAELLAFTPEFGSVVQADQSEKKILVSEIQPMDIVRFRPGDQISVDGEIIRGSTAIDQSSMTGESIPVDKNQGDAVFAGTWNCSGVIDVKATAVGTKTKLARIIQVVESSQSAKASIQRAMDQFAKIYTPMVVMIALVVAVFPPVFLAASWTIWLYKACVLLVIACPCALVISTPITIVSALSNAAKNGVLVKGGAFLERVRLLKFIAFDKTGTITTGLPTVSHFYVDDNARRYKWLALAASLAHQSKHPLSKAVNVFAEQQKINRIELTDSQEIIGKGIEASFQNKIYRFGNLAWLQSSGCTLDVAFQTLSLYGSQVWLAQDQTIIAVFEIVDQVRASSRFALQQLREDGIETILLSGDHVGSVNKLAQDVGIQQAFGGLLPEDKLQHLTQLSQKGVTAMVGDGINDAPALAKADIGFAMGGMGSDVAIETADVTLMNDDLSQLPFLMRLSKRTHRILMQNIGLALGIKLGFMVITLMGFGTLWMAVFADVGASLIVIMNGLRMLKS